MSPFALLAAAVLLATPALSAAQVIKSHGDYKVTVASVERTKQWDERNMQYIAKEGGIVVLVHLQVSSPNNQISLGTTKVEDLSGKSYESPKVSMAVTGETGKPIANAKIIVPFLVPASVDLKTFVLEGKTSFDIGSMAKQARQKGAQPGGTWPRMALSV